MPENTTNPEPRVRSSTPVVGGAAAVAAAALALAAPVIVQWEGGLRHDGSAIGYADHLARGLPTACSGLTGRDHLGRPIVVGRVYSAEECNAMLEQQLARRLTEIRACLPSNITAEPLGASLSLAFNIGSANFCRSSASRHFRAGNYAAACDAFMLWNKSASTQREIARGAGPLTVRQGLVNRRTAERALCRRGIPA